MKPAQARAACLLDGFRVNTGFFFEPGDTSFEDTQHLLHGIVLTLVFGLHRIVQTLVSIVLMLVFSLHDVEASVHVCLHGVYASVQGVNTFVHGVKASVDLVEHTDHRHKQTHQQHVVAECLPIQSFSILLSAARWLQGFRAAQIMLADHLQTLGEKGDLETVRRVPTSPAGVSRTA